MSSEATGPTKRQLLEVLLEKGMVLVHLDARADGVDVPQQFRGEEDLRLNISRRFQGGVELSEERVEATLSFSGQPYTCCLPFDAVYAMVSHGSGEGYFFPADAPAQALEALAALVSEEEGSGGTLAPSPEGARVQRPQLVALDGGVADARQPEQPSESDEEDVPAVARAPHLRVVK